MNVIILGASARAAAFSAHRAGLRPWCVDLFADADLEARFPVRKIALADYPHGLLDALADAPDGPVIYTGGLENYPDLIARIDRPLWGNPPEVLRRVRDPFLLAEVLRDNGWPVLEVRNEPPPTTDSRLWLLKPLRSSGGIGIRLYSHGGWFDSAVYYLQELAHGSLFGAAFLGMPGRGAMLLGTSWFPSSDSMNAPSFHYAGSIAARPMSRPEVEELGDLLVHEFELTGLFGIDLAYVVDPQLGRLVALLLEVNPRDTASIEVLERALDDSLLGLHCAIFGGGAVGWDSQKAARQTVHVKAVHYARQDLVFPAAGPWNVAFGQPADAVEYADIPHPGETIARGKPVMTLFGSGASPWNCLEDLRSKAAALDRHLYG